MIESTEQKEQKELQT